MRTARQDSPHALPAALLAAVLTMLALLASPAPARADGGQTLIERCTHGESLAGFSQAAYTQALSELSADAEEYTGCSQEIRQAQLAAAGGGTGAAQSSGVPTLLPATPAEQSAIAHAARAGAAPVDVGGQVIRPGVVPVSISSALSTLPTPLLLVVAGILVFILVIAAGGLRNFVRARRTD
jgi:hypothetical protein